MLFYEDCCCYLLLYYWRLKEIMKNLLCPVKKSLSIPTNFLKKLGTNRKLLLKVFSRSITKVHQSIKLCQLRGKRKNSNTSPFNYCWLLSRISFIWKKNLHASLLAATTNQVLNYNFATVIIVGSDQKMSYHIFLGLAVFVMSKDEVNSH